MADPSHRQKGCAYFAPKRSRRQQQNQIVRKLPDTENARPVRRSSRPKPLGMPLRGEFENQPPLAWGGVGLRSSASYA